MKKSSAVPKEIVVEQDPFIEDSDLEDESIVYEEVEEIVDDE